MQASRDTPAPPRAERIVALCGMHRSGTSMFARFLHRSGIDMGERLHVDRRTNPYGHYEDEDFLLVQRQELARTFDGEDYLVTEPFAASTRFRSEARALVEARRAASRGAPWGWKDPRTTLFLDEWLRLLPELRVVAMLRPPRDVLDSLCNRLRAYWSIRRKDHLLRVYAHYNATLLRFAREHPERTSVVALDALLASPAAVLTSLAERLEHPLDADAFRGLFDAKVMSRSRRALVIGNGAALRAAEETYAALLPLSLGRA